MGKDNLVNINGNAGDREEAMKMLMEINKVEGFDPTALAIPIEDGKYWLQVIYQIGWFRLKHPNGRIDTEVTPLAQEGAYSALAKIYADKNDEEFCYLARATASRAPDPDRPDLSAREWAQTAAVGNALRFAGFGLNFDLAGDGYGASIPDEVSGQPDATPTQGITAGASGGEITLDKAMNMRCPVSNYKDNTLGDLIRLDPNCLIWISQKSNNPEMRTAAQLIIDTSLNAAS